MKLLSIFNSNALYQACSKLTVRGFNEIGKTVKLVLCGKNVNTENKSVTGDNGMFEITIPTPTASYEKYEMTVSDGDETITLTNIMFGELWLASGQSNMELTNSSLSDCDHYLNKMKDFDIRVYMQEYGPAENFSTKPQYEYHGYWLSTLKPETFRGVSACATAFVYSLYRRFQQIGRADVPVGFLNVSWGGTTISSWISREVMYSKSPLLDYIKRFNWDYTEEDINDTSKEHPLFQRPGVMFNRKTAPCIGLKVRGIIWYQGESDNTFAVSDRNLYYEHLIAFYDLYKELFAVDETNFKMICALIYPWKYCDDGECCVGYTNNNFVKAATLHPDKFVCMPTYDLPPSWDALNNHPIHPCHKYPLGEKMAKLALTNVYGDEGQSSPAFMKECRRDGNKLVVRYDETKRGLYSKDGLHIRGMYIAGEDNLYMPADCEIISDNEIAVWHPYLEKPVHCCYGMSSIEPNLNLFAGEFPVMPFATDVYGEQPIKIEVKSFLNLEVLSELDFFDGSHLRPDWYYRPVWKPLDGCDVCHDNAFTMSTEGCNLSVGVGSRNETFGMYADSHVYHAFDFQKYSSLEVDVFNYGELCFDIVLDYDNGKKTKISTQSISDAACKFKHYSFDLNAIPEGRITRLTLLFNLKNERAMKHVNVGRIYLAPKK